MINVLSVIIITNNNCKGIGNYWNIVINSKRYMSTTRKTKRDPWINPSDDGGEDPNKQNWKNYNAHAEEIPNIIHLQHRLENLLETAVHLSKKLERRANKKY